MRYFIWLSYKGTNYNGWQIQPNAKSVQQTIQEALSTLLRHETLLTGAGRTDSGVHARRYAAHFDTETPIVAVDRFVYHLNALLPYDIAIHSIEAVAADAHARFDARLREYTYRIVSHKDPFEREAAWILTQPLDIAKMNESAAMLCEYDDFTSFAKLNSANKTNLCHVFYARWTPTDNGIDFKIGADRFLRGMVRCIVGTLVDVGRSKLSPSDFRHIITARNLSLCSSTAPAQGLYLTDIKY